MYGLTKTALALATSATFAVSGLAVGGLAGVPEADAKARNYNANGPSKWRSVDISEWGVINDQVGKMASFGSSMALRIAYEQNVDLNLRGKIKVNTKGLPRSRTLGPTFFGRLCLDVKVEVNAVSGPGVQGGVSVPDYNSMHLTDMGRETSEIGTNLPMNRQGWKYTFRTPAGGWCLDGTKGWSIDLNAEPVSFMVPDTEVVRVRTSSMVTAYNLDGSVSSPESVADVWIDKRLKASSPSGGTVGY